MKDVQCYELFGGIALKDHAFSFFKYNLKSSTSYMYIYSPESMGIVQLLHFGSRLPSS